MNAHLLPILRLMVVPALYMLGGCVVSIPTTPGADKIPITHKEADVASCKLISEVFGLTETNYVRDQRREMQNQTVDAGGDTLLITQEKDTPRGIAYRCEPAPGTEEANPSSTK